MIKIAKTRDELIACWPLMHELRYDVAMEDYLLMYEDMKAEGYNIAYLTDNNEIVSCAGFRINTTLFRGKFLYVDDLVTATKHRSKQYGDRIMSWLKNCAIENRCKHITLNSGAQRYAAHKFYLNQGFVIEPHRFTINL
ncbi:MAG: GNAT family N-acetyltransferase [Rhizobiales bacterium]|nr:GNAT family N-acetyltransferase [Hyphomicrobiales bacterium]